MKKLLFVLFIGALFILSGKTTVFACDDFPSTKPRPPLLICPTTSDYIDVNTDDTSVVENYLLNVSSVIEVNGEYFLLFLNQTDYDSEINDAIAYWNQLGIVHIESNNHQYQLLIIERDLGENNMPAFYTYEGSLNYLTINTYYFNQLTHLEKVRVIVHEFGHALGLDDVYEESSSIMVQGITEVIYISKQDIELLQLLYLEEE